VAGCGDDDAQSTTTAGPSTTAAESEYTTPADLGLTRPDTRSTVTFAFSPDPVIDYLKDTGALAEMEEAWNVKLEMTQSWDEFAFFAGGHGQVVSMATYDLPGLEAETGIDTVTFGQYNLNRNPVVVRADSPYQTLTDLKGQKILVGNPVGTTLIWGVIGKVFEDVDFLFEGGDYELALSDHAVNPELVARGEAEAAWVLPELAIPLLRTGELRVLYDPIGAPWEMWQEHIDPGHKGCMINVFTAEAEWYESHPYEVQFFLALWQEGLRLWEENKAEIIAEYPFHFAVESPEDIAYMQQYLIDHDWFVDTVYMDQEWVDRELNMYALMKQYGFMEEDAPLPDFDPVQPGG
jgi:ABC-type nitrate/sulfonate/bicarbonate transport system substrate-binding protein